MTYFLSLNMFSFLSQFYCYQSSLSHYSCLKTPKFIHSFTYPCIHSSIHLFMQGLSSYRVQLSLMYPLGNDEDNIYNLLNTHSVLSTVLNALLQSYLILTTSLWGRYYFPLFSVEVTRALKISYPESYTWGNKRIKAVPRSVHLHSPYRPAASFPMSDLS